MKGKLLLPILGTAVILSGCSSVNYKEFKQIESTEPGAPKAWLDHTGPNEGRGYSEGNYNNLQHIETLATTAAKHDLCAKHNTETKRKVRTTANVNGKGAQSQIATTGSITTEAKSQCEIGENIPEIIHVAEGNRIHVYAMVTSDNINEIVNNQFSQADAQLANSQTVD
jgi:hypothetical protein